MKMFDGSILFEVLSTKWIKNNQKCQKRREANAFFCFVTTTIISKHSRKISRECFKLLYTSRSILKIDPNILHNAPS